MKPCWYSNNKPFSIHHHFYAWGSNHQFDGWFMAMLYPHSMSTSYFMWFGTGFFFSIHLGISLSQVPNSYFGRGVGIPATRDGYYIVSKWFRIFWLLCSCEINHELSNNYQYSTKWWMMYAICSMYGIFTIHIPSKSPECWYINISYMEHLGIVDYIASSWLRKSWLITTESFNIISYYMIRLW